MKKEKRKVADVTAIDCIAALKAHFPSPEYALFEQVANGTGWSGRRWADAVAMGIWPSRGLLMHGFEIKVDRADWKRELKNPKKVEESLYQFCDRWWIVAPTGLIEASELPPTWGLYEVSEARKLKALVVAPELTPKPLTKAFVAAVLRRQSECLHDVIRRERHEAREEGAKSGAGALATRLERAESRYEDLRGRTEEFEKKSGVHLDNWNLGNVAEAVKRIADPTYRTHALESLQREAELYKRQLKNVKEEIAAIESLPTREPLVNAEPSRDEEERDHGEDHRNVAVG